MTKSEGRAGAVEQLDAAREERDQRAEQYKDAGGSPRELAAFTELQAAEDHFAAREAWVKWIDRDY